MHGLEFSHRDRYLGLWHWVLYIHMELSPHTRSLFFASGMALSLSCILRVFFFYSGKGEWGPGFLFTTYHLFKAGR